MKIKISINPVLDIETGTWSNDSEFWIEEENLPIRLDRAAQNEAKSAVAKAGQVADTSQGYAQQEHNALTPFYRQEMNTQHAFNPGQTNELLNYAGAGAGGANATSQGQIESEAARTRNTAGFTPALQQAARDRSRQMSESNLGVGAQDVMGAKQLNQEGAAGEAGLFGADTDTMLKSMGQQNEDINTQIKAGQSGWLQNLTNTLGAAGGFIGALKRR